MVREAQHEPAMTTPEALAIADKAAPDGTQAEATSLDAFVRAHYPRLVRLAGLITRDVDQAQDAVQAALERAWRKHGGIRNDERLRPWLDRIVVREAIRQGGGGLLGSLFQRPATDWANPTASTPDPAERAIVREALGRLSPNHRAVIALHLHAGYSVEETAQVLGVPIDTVRSRLRAARERVRAELGVVS
jgi:RNA polymerase sigma-70 factor, ECF subfamily